MELSAQGFKNLNFDSVCHRIEIGLLGKSVARVKEADRPADRADVSMTGPRPRLCYQRHQLHPVRMFRQAHLLTARMLSRPLFHLGKLLGTLKPFVQALQRAFNDSDIPTLFQLKGQTCC
jgi:hypothetical protein